MKPKMLFVGIIGICLAFLFPYVEKKDVSAQSRSEIHVVSAHTSGKISREGTIRVRFIENIATADRLNMPLEESPITFTPKIKGTALWVNSQTLEFQPKDRLPTGRDYVASVDLSKIMETQAESETFSFEFSTMKQSFEITLDGLSPINRKDPKRQQLKGKVVTADSENRKKLEKIMAASQGKNDLKIKWSHGTDRREHTFVIDGIMRKDDSTMVVLQWDGSPIGVDKKGKRIIPVPSMNYFEVAFARAVQGKEQYIEVRFSDPLEKQQDLRGLITVAKRKHLRFAIEGNSVRVYCSQRWSGSATLHVNPGIRNTSGQRITAPVKKKVYFEEVKPQVRFAGKGIIVPTTQGLTIPIESVNLRAVRVEAMRIYEKNIPQFLQVNDLDGKSELKRVGRTIWKKTIRLGWSADKKNRWVRSGLDVGPLIEGNPGGIYKITLTFKRRHIVYPCAASTQIRDDKEDEALLENFDEETQSSYWDSYEQNEEYNWNEWYRNRNNPCHAAYYEHYGDHDIEVSRNIFISDIGLIAKKGSNAKVFVAATGIQTAQPLAGVALTLVDYQHQPLSEGKTAKDGTAILRAVRKPFLLIARHADQTGYLKLDDGSARSVSHFDVSGQTVKKGLKGFIYGERGVWRPGDPIYLTFILKDDDSELPENHPVRFELLNPRGQRTRSLIRKTSLNGFYSFHTQTDPDAPTGNWTARITVGGITFEKILKIETVMPNRLKIGLDFGAEISSLSGGEINGQLSSTWLHGAIAKNLKSDVELTFKARKTVFPKFEAYEFDDPVRQYEPETLTIFEGNLDDKGRAAVTADIQAQNVSPGMLTANFRTRVFEPSGAFSVDHYSIPYHPYERYVGIRVPKGDKARGMLLTDTDHIVGIVVMDAGGNPLPSGKVEVKLHKIKWRWWWEKGEESIADYLGSSSYRAIKTDTLQIQNGRGQWKFQIKYPSWGRYLIRVRDMDGKHIAGKIVYIDWPGWAGRAQKDSPGGATVLNFSADKQAYTVGENVVLTIPTGKKGRGLLSIESGSKILQTAWIEGGAEPTRFEFAATAEMTPNIYVHVTFLQPHLQAGNDLPIRMYGIIPIKVVDPTTRLKPVVKTPEVFRPQERDRIAVSEANGKPMTYTVAIVDEGLLDLTRFTTPDPWDYFYNRESLGVKTWDLFDQVAGAYGGMLEQMLAIGGDEAAEPGGPKKADRFPPMVRFIGPFELAENAENTHEIAIPQYVGSVKVMVVAGQKKAFGAAQQAVFVRKPLMILGTLPRVLGPEEDVDLPVYVFALEDKLQEVTVNVSTEGPLSVTGPPQKRLTFSDPGDQLITFTLKAGLQMGLAKVLIQAAGGEETSAHEIELDIRMPGGHVVDIIKGTIPANETWQKEFRLPGIAGTNEVMLEVSRIPPLNLGSRLTYLIRYPHGCVEQITSSVFPQLFLDKLLQLSPQKKDNIQRNIQAGIERLRTFQASDGGFAYWPGAAESDEWATNYAGHFLLEAEKIGYLLPAGLMEHWKMHQRKMARSWVTGPERSEITQAYRLYTLALADAAELGAMNRLREERDLPTAARWRLATAYQLAGQPEAAEHLARNAGFSISPYRELSNTYGSDLRDEAMILESLCLLNQAEKTARLAQQIANELGDSKWLSTQTTAYALVAMARLVGITEGSAKMSFSYTWGNAASEVVSAASPMVQKTLAAAEDTAGKITITNTGNTVLYPRIIVEGFPPVEKETASRNGMSITAKYFGLEDNRIEPDRLEQGTDFVAEVTVKNTGNSGTYEEVALTHITASGWEIHNARMEPGKGSKNAVFDYQDIRDDRIYTYFDIKQGESKTFQVILNASYLGKFYLPMIMVEAMYDASINAREPGKWIRVVKPGAGGDEDPAANELIGR
jgi:uncharacterized protein YfaS (alpha-2-macroglobulin family)